MPTVVELRENEESTRNADLMNQLDRAYAESTTPPKFVGLGLLGVFVSVLRLVFGVRSLER